MSLIELVQNVAREAGYAVDTKIIESTDNTTRQLLAMTNRVIREMADAYNWTKLRKTGVIVLVDGQSTYELPSDFSHYHHDTFWNQSDGWRLFGPLSSVAYAERIGWEQLATVYDEFMLEGMTDRELTIYPTPDAGSDGQVIIFRYTSLRPVRPRRWENGLQVQANEYCSYNGEYYVTGSSGTTSGSKPSDDSGVTWALYEGPYETFRADTDEPVLSQRLLEQGVLERFAEIKSLTVSARFDDQLQDEYAKNLPGKVLYAGGVSRAREQYARSGRVSFGGRYN